MIENTSTLSREDMRFLIAQNNRSVVQYLRRLLALAWGVYLVGFVIWLAVRHSSFAYWTNTAVTLIGITMGPWCIVQALFHQQIMLRKALKTPEFQTPRHYLADAEGVTIQTVVSGVEMENRFPFSNAEGYYLTADTVYMRFRLSKKEWHYMCFHDDGYAQGDRISLIALLDARGIPQK